MKKRTLFYIFILLIFFIISLYIFNIKTIMFDKYISIHPKEWDKLTVNKNWYVIYKDKVILKNNFIPLSNKTAILTSEIKAVIAAEKIEPKEDCDPSDTIKNGTLGCYVYVPGEE